MESDSKINITIVNSVEDFDSVVTNIEDATDVIVYTNLICEATIGDSSIDIKGINTCICSDEKGMLILVPCFIDLNMSSIDDRLTKKRIPFSVLTFVSPYPNKYHAGEVHTKFISTHENLENIVKQISESSKDRACEYFPFKTGSISLFNINNNMREPFLTKPNSIKGVLEFNEYKILLSAEGKELDPENVLNLFDKYNISYEAITSSNDILPSESCEQDRQIHC